MRLGSVARKSPSAAARFWNRLLDTVVQEGGLPGHDRKLFDDAQRVARAMVVAEAVLGPTFERPKRPGLELAQHCPPAPTLCLEAIANLNTSDVFSLFWLAGFLTFDADPKWHDGDDPGAEWVDILMEEYGIDEQELTALRAGVELVQSMVGQITEGGREVELTTAQVRRLRSLAATRLFLPVGVRPSVGLVELCDPSGLDQLARATAGRRDDGLAAVPSSWWARADDEDLAFGHNWILARAAAHVMDCCAGLTPNRIRHCPKCEVYWVHEPTPGDVKYCPDCRPGDIRSQGRQLRRDSADGRWFIYHGNEVWYVAPPPDVLVDVGDGVQVAPDGRVRLDTDQRLPLTVLERRPRRPARKSR